MFEAYLGEGKFRNGTRIYMKAHAYSNSTTADLWAALEKASRKAVESIAAGFTEHPGVPLIQVTRVGINLHEVRVILGEAAEIVAAVNALLTSYDYRFTTGGIGPAHDDVTANAVATALGVGISEDPRAIKVLLEQFEPADLNEARRRMARIPHGAELIEYKISKAPGFWIENVIVFEGVPLIMRAMLDDVAPKLTTGGPMITPSWYEAMNSGEPGCP
jgi:hypothetical protein